LQRTPASIAAIAELTFPVVAIVVGYLAFGETLTASQLAGVALTSFVVLLLPARAPALVKAEPVPSAA
jgi:drug/metabolite transporter (DMT)-like permease